MCVYVEGEAHCRMPGTVLEVLACWEWSEAQSSSIQAPTCQQAHP